MKRILFIMPSLVGGGAEKVLFDLVKSLDKEKYEIDLFLIENEGVYIEDIKKNINNYNCLFSTKRPKINKIKIFQKFISLFRRPKLLLFRKGWIDPIDKKYDVEIAFLEGWPTEYLANRKTVAKKIAWVHTDLEKHRVLSKKVEEKVYDKMDTIVCVSQDSKKSILKLYPNIQNKTEVIYNPILKEEILEKAAAKVEKITDENKITLIASGRLKEEKGFDILLKAHKELLEEGLDYNLKILGDGPLRKKIENYILENKLQKNTELLGFKKNPHAYVKQADVFVVSSRYEGYSLVLAEAMVLGLPIISTKCIGPLEILNNGEYGLLVECEDVLSLKNGLKKMIIKEEERKKYKKLSENRLNFFDLDKVLKDIQKILENEEESYGY